ncbi:hypothetical protein [Kordia sp.]|uniref:hypothetical protein n=1 Tax=Kordia sp. TaxID=1965332 RepID=UPI003D266552
MKKKIIIALTLIIVSIILVFILPRFFFKKDLKDSLSSILNISPDNLILNLPPSGSRVPGSVLLPYNNSYLIYNLNDHSDSDLIKGKTFSVMGEINDFSKITSNPSSGIMESVFSNSQHFKVLIKIDEGQVSELPINRLKEIVSESKDVIGAINEKKQPIIIYKAYSGIVSYVISAKDEKGIDLLNDFNEDVKELSKKMPKIEIKSSLKKEKSISFKLTEPVIIAYEALLIDFVINNLSIDDIKPILTPITVDELEAIESKNSDKISKKNEKKNWGLITIASGHFKNMASLDAPEAKQSADLVKDILNKYAPKFIKSLHSSEDDELTDDELLDWTIDLTMEMLNNPVDYLLIYYVGHGVSLPNGEIVLLQGNLNKDFAERAIENITPNTSSSGDGLLLTETLYNSFEMTGIPFTLFLDACYPNAEMQKALQRVSMTLGSEDGTNLIYYGNEDFITDEMSEISNVLSEIGNRFQYRTNKNPIIFSSKPGAKAIFQDNPISYYSTGVAPIAKRLINYSQYNNYQNPISLYQLIRNTTDLRQGIGEISLGGTITWSNFDDMKKFSDSLYIN